MTINYSLNYEIT